MGIDHSDDSSDDGIPGFLNGVIFQRRDERGDDDDEDDDNDDVMNSDDEDSDGEGAGRGSLRRCTHQ